MSDQGDNEQQATSEGYYNPRPRARSPQPRVEVEQQAGLTGSKVRVRVLFGTEGASSLSSVFTLCNSAVGAGVLSLPYAFQCAGLVGCLVLSLCVAGLESFTMYVLAKFAERYDANSYGSLVRRALGKKTAACLSGVLLVYLWGSCVAYLVIVADTFTSLSVQYLGPEAWLSQRPVVVLTAGALALLMCFPRNLSALERVSFAAVLGFLYTAGAVLVRGTQAITAKPDPWAGVTLLNTDIQALYAISIVVFGFNCHANVVSVFYELEHYPHRLITQLPAEPTDYHTLGPLVPKPYTYKLIGMLGAILSAQGIILVGYMAVGVAGYLAYPVKVSSNVLNSFGADDVAIQVARAVIGCVVLGHYPLNHHPARKGWEDLLDAVFDVKQIPGWLSAVLTIIFVCSNVLTSLVVTDLGQVLHMIGGTAASFMIFFLPGLLLMNAAIIKHTHSCNSLSELRAPHPQEPCCRRRCGAGSSTVPLLDKKAGIRDAGLVFAPGKSWFMGLLLVIISGLVLAVTLLTALLN
ncbi:transmembrane amino acid transporter protein-domain-containing protein [Scenedesmus sp. NREL 46B-D3]|nr:transmembrane amino acid transporter protein-domain-containing protein [Scenedesmus sp. NREL 46B-D3]